MNHITTISCPINYNLDTIKTLLLEEGGEYDINNKSKVILNINNGILIVYKIDNNIIIERNNKLNSKMIEIMNRIINILKRDILLYYTERFSIETSNIFYNNK